MLEKCQGLPGVRQEGAVAATVQLAKTEHLQICVEVMASGLFVRQLYIKRWLF